MAEVQAHGIKFEKELILRITGKTKKEYQKLLKGQYSASMDIAKNVFSEHDYSIKVTGSNSIGCADLIRFMTHCKTTDFIMVVGCWTYNDTETLKIYNQIYEFYFSPEHVATLFANLNLENIAPFVEYVKGIPPGKEHQLLNQDLWKEKRENLYEEYGKGLIYIDAKINSSKQRRVQCSLKISDLTSSNIPFNIYTTEYKGLPLPYVQKSKPRKIKKS
jgi:hypothetical protein